MIHVWRWLARVRSPLILAAVLSVAIGVGVNGAEFSLLKHVLVPPVPLVRADEIVLVSQKHRTQSVVEFPCAPGFYLAVKARVRCLNAVAAYVKSTQTGF